MVQDAAEFAVTARTTSRLEPHLLWMLQLGCALMPLNEPFSVQSRNLDNPSPPVSDPPSLPPTFSRISSALLHSGSASLYLPLLP